MSAAKFCIMPRMPLSHTLWSSNSASELVADAASQPCASPSSDATPSCRRAVRGMARAHAGAGGDLRDVQRSGLERRIGIL
jgi:hypothetical protein